MDRFYEKLEASFQRKFCRYIVKVSKVKGSFYVLIRKPGGKILNDDLNNLFKDVKSISTRIYNKFSGDSSMFCYNFFPYFKLVRCYGSYHYHFLVVRKDYVLRYECLL